MTESSPRPTPLPPPAPLVRDIVERALREDLQGGDLTSEATIARDLRVAATAWSKSALVCCGNPVARAVFRAVDESLEFEELTSDGARASVGKALWRVVGSARSILAAERTALNFIQRLSGIATMAHRYVREVPVGCATRITDTRKTTPGLRVLERYAVRTGGAHNHRQCLGSGVLLKDNHIRAAGGIGEAVRRARAYAAHTSRVEVEVTSFEELARALEARADIVMLDNFDAASIRDAVMRVDGRALVEVSGNVTLARVAELARTGAHVISVGALTHSAPAADISLLFDTNEH